MSIIKTIAMYLPQFHEIPENSQWWGTGFTEWMAVRKAEKYFEGHNQPREPLNGNYYNLLEKETMQWQANLAQKYGLDGFCFYHYYFKDGKKILEKPAENLLQWKDLNMPYCFCWANESWARTWSKIGEKNTWADKFESVQEIEGKENGVLLQQKYGREQVWQEHFDYLLPFFKDDRYIKLDGCPIFLIYKPNDIICLAEMMHYWKNRARRNGIKDIYVIGMNLVRKTQGVDAILFHGPVMYCYQELRGRNIEAHWKNGIRSIRYDEVWENAVEAVPVPGCKTYFGGFTDFDNTPRNGRKGWLLDGTSMDIFEKYLYRLMKKNQEVGNEYVFINAFNEWGEGMYLEPDTKNGWGYLEILKRTKEKVNAEHFQISNCKEEELKEEDNIRQYRIEKLSSYVSLMDRWMLLREKKQHLSDYLKKYHYDKIAIYGVGILGKHLISELCYDGIEIKYIIDKKEEPRYAGIKICKLSSDLEKVDAIIVTPTYEYQYGDIGEEIRKYIVGCPIVSLAELIYEFAK